MKQKMHNVNYFKLFLRALFISKFIVFAAVIFMSGVSGKSDSLNARNAPPFNMFVIVSESMVPTIKINDGIVIRKINDDSVDIGDIITFASSDRRYKGLTITHRVVGKQFVDGKYIYRTKGDNNILEDTSVVDINNIYGKVIFKIPKIGYLQGFVSSPAGFILLICIPVLIVIIYEAIRLKFIYNEKIKSVEID